MTDQFTMSSRHSIAARIAFMVAVSCISVQAAAPSLSRYLYFAATQLVLFAYLRSREHEGADRKPQPAHPASRLEEYRRRQAYETLERFHEEGESAKTTDRSHPGVRRTCLAARRRPVGTGVTRTPPAVPTSVLSGRNVVRRKRLYWKRRNRTNFQLLADDRGSK